MAHAVNHNNQNLRNQSFVGRKGRANRVVIAESVTTKVKIKNM
jgi:hypothetical protein